MEEKKNKELYDTAMPALKKICENYFYHDIAIYKLDLDEGDKFFKNYDECLEYDYSCRKRKYPDEEPDEGELWFGRYNFYKPRVKTGLAVYKLEKWNEVYHHVLEVLDEKHIEEFEERYHHYADSLQCFEPSDLLYKEFCNSKNNKDAEEENNDEGSEEWEKRAYKFLLNDPEYVMTHLESYPEAGAFLHEKWQDGSEEKETENLFHVTDLPEYAAAVCYYLSKYYAEGKGGLFEKNEEKAYRIVKESLEYAEPCCEGRQSSRPYAAFGRLYYLFGKFHELGLGTSVDYKKAGYYYLKAADYIGEDYIPALGDLYLYGKGVPQDYRKAYLCYQSDNPYNFYAKKYKFAKLRKEETEHRLSFLRDHCGNTDDFTKEDENSEDIREDFDVPEEEDEFLDGSWNPTEEQ